MPNYVKFRKDILSKKRRHGKFEIVALKKKCKAFLLNKLPLKKKDPGCFTIPYNNRESYCDKALCDLRTSINLMSMSMFRKLGIGEVRLNEDIQLLVGILELKELVVLVKRACKAEELAKEKQKANLVSRDLKKRQLSKPFQSSSKKSRERHHPSEYRGGDRTCFKCGSPDHFVGECPERTERRNLQGTRSDGTANKGRPQRNPNSGRNRKGSPREPTVRSEGRAPTRTYAIRACEEASSPNVITSTFSIYDITIVTLIDPGSTYLYVCMKLVSDMNLLVESTEFIIKVSNLLGKYVLVDKVCKNCPLLIKGHYFSANLMLLPFDEFDVILDELNGMPAVISSMAAQKCVRKGYEVYLAFVLNMKESELKIESVPIVSEYPDVFPEELPRLPPVRALV
ncbi:uncharacterized protein [Gossypium hirsutum]|uniref:CCHC-type domain-containing protein n=1 Tax=Gossypium hirsutum TaxID=3635 RepID=A0ABM2ZDD1_GOSHI|nr:uncharacterized protein LOC107894600 [Gossypium hirsutum]